MKYFSIEELTRSSTARRRGIDNTPNDPEILTNLTELIDKILDPARERLGAPIHVNSGYRCQLLNQVVGGNSNSQHTKGQAADICTRSQKDMLRLLNILKSLPFDQLGIYGARGRYRFFHVSYNPNRSKQRNSIFTSK